jgi:hypothetical protein
MHFVGVNQRGVPCQFARVVIFVTFIWEVPSLSLEWDTDCIEVLHACPHSLQQISGILGLPSIPTPFQICHLLSIIYWFDTACCSVIK